MKRLHIPALLATALFASTAAQACEITLRSADTHPNGYPTVEAVKKMGEVVKQRSNNRLCIQVFPSATLGEEKDTIEQTQFGVIDMVRSAFGTFNNIVPETQVPTLPYVFRSVEHMHKAMDGEPGEIIAKAFEQHDMVVLGFMDAGARSFYNSKRPIKSIDDLNGLKFRVIQSDILVDMTNALGATPTPMPYGEVYSGIQTGVIDGAENNEPSYDTSGHYEVAKYYTLNQHMIMPEALVISKVTWDKLTPEDQALLKQAGKEAGLLERELWAVKEKESLANVEKAGAQVIRDIDKQPFIDRMGPVYKKYITTPELQALFDKIQAIK